MSKQDGIPETEMQDYPTPSAGNPYPTPSPPGGYQTPVVVVPMAVSRVEDMWMTVPQGIPNCPRGLEYLTMVDQLLVKQKMEMLEVFANFETKNKYIIKNSMGQNVYAAFEESGFFARECLADLRPFNMRIVDNAQNEVITINRPFACKNCCCPCNLQSVEVFAPPGQLIGRVRQNWSICNSDFSIENADGDTVLKIRGPIINCSCGSDIDFKVLEPKGNTQVGKISKQWSGMTKEYFTDADNFGVTFPMDLDVRMKAVMLGAVFLIDFMFFEEPPRQN